MPILFHHLNIEQRGQRHPAGLRREACIPLARRLHLVAKMGQHLRQNPGETVDFLLTAHRDQEAAFRFLTKAIRRNGVPETITIDGSDANEAAIKRYNQEHGTHIIIRQVKYLNNIVEQDHRAVKRITRPMLGFKSFDAAHHTLVGIELMHMLKKRQLVVKEEGEDLTSAELFYSLAA
jgi:putative transposase